MSVVAMLSVSSRRIIALEIPARLSSRYNLNPRERASSAASIVRFPMPRSYADAFPGSR